MQCVLCCVGSLEEVWLRQDGQNCRQRLVFRCWARRSFWTSRPKRCWQDDFSEDDYSGLSPIKRKGMVKSFIIWLSLSKSDHWQLFTEVKANSGWYDLQSCEVNIVVLYYIPCKTRASWPLLCSEMNDKCFPELANQSARKTLFLCGVTGSDM